ncbi:MAG: HEAT repeat domain-containing protein [bacterium]|nr:HEAT repeat domain-containing protein [bacterium]
MRVFSETDLHDPSRAKLVQRTFLLFELEIARGTPVEIVRRGQRFESPELGEIKGRYLAALMRAMEIHSIERCVLSESLACEDLSRFVHLLALSTPDLDQLCERGFAGRLYESTAGGIEINDVAREAPGEQAAQSAEPRADSQAPLDCTPEAPGAASRTLAHEQFSPPGSWPALEEDPLEAPAMVMKGEQLRLGLRELDRCEDDLLYDSLLDRIGAGATELWNLAHREECYRALLVLTAHASGDGDRPRPHALMAQSVLVLLASEEIVEFLIERSCDCDAGGVRPTQVLLQLGERSAPPLLDALNEETDAGRSKQLAAMVLALGEHAIPTLIKTVAGRRGARLQLAVRLAGELQSPKLVPTLANIFHDSGPALRKEAGMALVHIGSLDACDVLVRALSDGGEDLARVAALCLGVLGEDHTAQPLLAALDRAIASKQTQLAQALVRSLGQLRGHHLQIISALAALLDTQRTVPRTALRLAALETLGGFDDGEAQRLLIAATCDEDPEVSRKAHEVLNERDRKRSR